MSTKRSLLLGAAGCLLLASEGWSEELVLAEDGKSRYHIVVAVDASMQDYYAGQVLQRYVKEMSGADLRIVGDDNALAETEIIVGFNRHLNRLGLELEKDAFGPEEFLIKTVGQTLVITGGSPRGVLYGVNSLLTDEWGCRWFTPDLKRIPKSQRLTLPPTERRYQPPFEWRDVFFWSGSHSEWVFHNFQNKDWANLRPEQGWRSGISHYYFVHTAHGLVSPEEYLEDHPDYFWTGGDDEPRSNAWAGKRKWTGLCLTHPEVTKIAAQTLLEAPRQHPEGDLYYCISGMDYGDWCECPRCRQWHTRELGGNLPEDSGHWPHGALWLDFAARVQALLKDEPDAPRITMLAYGYCPVPPRNPVMHEDLNVFYTELSVQQFHPLNSPDNHDFRQRLAGWLKCAGSVYVWRYLVNFEGWNMVHPNMHTFAEDLRYLRDVGIKGIFAQGNQVNGLGQRFSGEMNELRAYLLARLMWNPDLDWRRERREFCAAYYGAAAGAVIEEYLDDLRKTFVVQDVHCTSGLPAERFRWITPQVFARWYDHMDKAESLAEDEEHKRLVRIARLPVQFTEANIEQDPAQRQALLQSYVEDARELVAAHRVTEHSPFEEWVQRMGLE